MILHVLVDGKDSGNFRKNDANYLINELFIFNARILINLEYKMKEYELPEITS